MPNTHALLSGARLYIAIYGRKKNTKGKNKVFYGRGKSVFAWNITNLIIKNWCWINQNMSK